MVAAFDGRKTEDLNQGRRGGLVIALRNISTGEQIPLESARRRWVLGSEAACDVRLEDRYVSGMHCTIERRGDGTLLLRDRASRNGTYLDGSAVEVAELRAGSFVSLGRTTLLAVAGAESAGGAAGAPMLKAIEQLRGSDPRTRATIEKAVRAAQTDCSVLVVGETGTGKDLIARIVHESSRRASGPFVAVNCGAIPRELIGSELFGHERGAFTGASDSREGYFVEAHGGTLFLDEIGELPMELQPHLLRVLETRRVRRLGGAQERTVDVRIVAATNRAEGLGTEASGHLRLDLYHRLATMVLSLTPLRERAGDIVEIVRALLDDAAGDFGPKRVSTDGWRALTTYAWPGNVRELKHAVARAIALGGSELGPMDFFPDLVHRFARLPTESGAHVARERLVRASDGGPPERAGLPPIEAMVCGAMQQALQQHGSIRAAAQALGMPKSTFAEKAQRWGITSLRRRPRLTPPVPGPVDDDDDDDDA